MDLGKRVRLGRLFSHPSGRLCSVAVDHLIGYGAGLPPGLLHIQPTLAALVAGQPDAVTMHRGLAASAWGPHAGKVPLILQSTLAVPEDTPHEQIATPEDAVRYGADAFAVVAFLRGQAEAVRLRTVAECVRQAERLGMPVICHAYPRDLSNGGVSFAPEDIAWVVRCAVECGADVVKAPYCGDVRAQAQIVADCPVPLVAAGGPKSGTLEAALAMMAEVIESGTRGATIGRNIWGFPQVTAAVQAFKAVIHDGASPQEALRSAGL